MTAPLFPPAQAPDATAAVAPERGGLQLPSLWSGLKSLGRDLTNPQTYAEAAKGLVRPFVDPYGTGKEMGQEASRLVTAGRPTAATAMTAMALGFPEAGGEGAELSSTASRFLGDLEHAVKTGGKLPKFALLSADRPGLPPELLAERHRALGDAIRDLGFEPVEHAGGVWEENRESGYLVPGMKPAQARHLGERFGQQAVITHDAYHDLQTGQSFPFSGLKDVVRDDPHILLPSGTKLGMQFDFEHPAQGLPERVQTIMREGGTDLPAGAPRILGASEPKYAYRTTGSEPKPGPTLGEGGILRTELPHPEGTRHGLPLAEEDIKTLGVAGRHMLDKFPDKGTWVRAMQTEHPNYAPHLEGYAGDRAYAVAKRASLPPMPDQPQIEHLARSAEGASTRPWYHTWWPAVSRAFGPEDGEMLTRFHAVLSAQASPERNAQLSLAALEDYKAGKLDFPSVGTMGSRLASLRRVAEAGPTGSARMAQEGPKVNSFYLALKGHPEAVVLDRHMARAYLGPEYGRDVGGKHLSNEQYYGLDARVRRDAKDAGVSPRDYQAMVWGGQTKYPFEPPEDFLWKHLSRGNDYEIPKGFESGGRDQPILRELQHYTAKRALMQAVDPSHAAVRVGEHVFEVPMARGHAGALEKAIEALREPGFNADDIMSAAEDGYTHGDKRFIPRADVDNLHSSDFMRGRNDPRRPQRDDDQ